MRQAAKTLEMFEDSEAKKEVVEMKDTKEFEYRRAPSGLYYLAYAGGGELPAVLKGHYTSSIKAKDSAASYLEGKRNAKATS